MRRQMLSCYFAPASPTYIFYLRHPHTQAVLMRKITFQEKQASEHVFTIEFCKCIGHLDKSNIAYFTSGFIFYMWVMCSGFCFLSYFLKVILLTRELIYFNSKQQFSTADNFDLKGQLPIFKTCLLVTVNGEC